MERITEFLEQRRQKQLFRVLHPAHLRKGGRIWFEGKEYIDFSSNDYLGLD